MKFTAVLLSIVLASSSMLAAQQPLSPADEIEAVRQLAAAIPLGSRVKLQMTSGRRLTGTLMMVDQDAIVVKRDSRRPEPALTIAFDELLRLQRDERNGFSMTKAIGVGLAAGVGAILTLFAFAVALGD